MSVGHVFHPGHEALHGVTVVVVGSSGRHYIGRYHETSPRGVILHDGGLHEPGGPQSVEDWVARQLKFGVRVEQKTLVVPTDEATRIVPLLEWTK